MHGAVVSVVSCWRVCSRHRYFEQCSRNVSCAARDTPELTRLCLACLSLSLSTHAVIIFDWDDTICPSSFVDQFKVDTFSDLPLHVSPFFSSLAISFPSPLKSCLFDRHGREIEIFGSHGCAAEDMPDILNLVASGRLNPKALVEREVGLAEGAKAIMDMDNGSPIGITMVTFSADDDDVVGDERSRL